MMTAVWSVQLPHTDKLVLLALADNANDEGTCWPSINTLRGKCGMDERTVRRVIDRLEAAGHLTQVHYLGRSSTFTVHPGQKVTPGTAPGLAQDPDPPGRRPGPLRAQDPDPPGTAPGRTIIEPSSESSGNPKVEARAARSAPATRLPDDFELTPERRAIAETEKADPEREFQNFTDYWLSASGAKARKHDWDRTWRMWCRRAPDFRPRGNGTPAPKRTWRPPDDDEVPNADH